MHRRSRPQDVKLLLSTQESPIINSVAENVIESNKRHAQGRTHLRTKGEGKGRKGSENRKGFISSFASVDGSG